MSICRRRSIVLIALGGALALLSLARAATANSPSSLPLLDLTPSAYAYLPLVIRQPAPADTLIPPDDIEKEQSVMDQINQHRQAHGLTPLDLASELTQAARRHSHDMAENGFTSHTGSDGSDPGQRIEEAGYEWTAWGEIIGWGFGGDPESVVSWWINSPSHRSIILSTDYEDLGVGYARDPSSAWVHYWTVNFGKRAAGGPIALP
jgi:uncharacterized protein YkwD